MTVRSTRSPRLTLAPILLAALASVCPAAHGALRVTLRNGSEFDCIRQELSGGRIRLYLLPTAPTASSDTYIEVAASSVLSVETVPDPLAPPAIPAPAAAKLPTIAAPAAPLTPDEMRQMLARAGSLHHNIDVDLLASVVKAESNGNARAVSRAGARGLMQLMPATASDLGVHDSFAPDQNISGGTAYLDQLLDRYDPDNDTRGLELALAAYNAGPAAVDRYHGIPPFAETRAYVARVISEFNRRKRAAKATLTASAH